MLEHRHFLDIQFDISHNQWWWHRRTTECYRSAAFILTLHPNPATDQLFLEGLANYPDAVGAPAPLAGRPSPLISGNGQADISHLPPAFISPPFKPGKAYGEKMGGVRKTTESPAVDSVGTESCK